MSQASLVAHLVNCGVLHRNSLASRAMLRTDRAHYCKGCVYEDHPESIGFMQTISAPHMHATALEYLTPAIAASARDKRAVRILDVGSGSGYLTAALARMAEDAGSTDTVVVGVETVGELARRSIVNIESDDNHLLADIRIIQGDGWSGCEEWGPYDAIHVGAAADTFPAALGQQLNEEGVMVIPLGEPGTQMYTRCMKHNGDIKCDDIEQVMFVPLIHP